MFKESIGRVLVNVFQVIYLEKSLQHDFDITFDVETISLNMPDTVRVELLQMVVDAEKEFVDELLKVDLEAAQKAIASGADPGDFLKNVKPSHLALELAQEEHGTVLKTLADWSTMLDDDLAKLGAANKQVSNALETIEKAATSSGWQNFKQSLPKNIGKAVVITVVKESISYALDQSEKALWIDYLETEYIDEYSDV